MDGTLNLKNPPAIEAVLDIDCAMPPNFDLSKFEKDARDKLRATYKHFRKQFAQQTVIRGVDADATDAPVKPPELQVSATLLALQFLQQENDKPTQIVQLRSTGYSFNRLAPYGHLDDYIPEIKRTWEIVRGVLSPLSVKQIRLRYLNRILLPIANGKLDLGKYLTNGPTTPCDDLEFTAFLNQYTAIIPGTKNQVQVVLTAQAVEADKLPILFDITATHTAAAGVDNLPWILERIQELRVLKNRVFKDTLTPECLNLFQ